MVFSSLLLFYHLVLIMVWYAKGSSLCTSLVYIVLQLVFDLGAVTFVSISQYVTRKLLCIVEAHVDQNQTHAILNKLEGIDMKFLLHQVYCVKIVMLINLITHLYGVFEKTFFFFGVYYARIQGCRRYESLVIGKNLKFFEENQALNEYNDDVFETLEFIDESQLALLRLFLPFSISLYTYYKMIRNEPVDRNQLQMESS